MSPRLVRCLLLLAAATSRADGFNNLFLQAKNTEMALEKLTHDLPMNVDFQLRLLGLRQNTTSK